MPRQKMVNGVLIDLSEAELAEIEARVEASDLDLTMVRADRNSLLRNSDWTQVADGAFSAEKVAEWATYRQELRDLPSTVTRQSELRSVDPDTNEVTDNWPTPPE